MLPDRSLLIGQKLVENAKMQNSNTIFWVIFKQCAKGVVSGHENAILYPRFLDRWIHSNFGKKKIVIDMGKPMDWDMKLFKRHFKMTNLSVSKAHKLFRKLLPKRLFNTRGIIGIIRFDSSLSISPKDPRLSSFVSCGCCSLGKLRGSRERKRLKERCREYRSHSILGLL